MCKKIILSSLFTLVVFLSGCGNENTTCRMDIQKAIDKGDYDRAISELNGKCATAFTSSDLNMNLAAAYMGKSGYSVSSIADMLINSDDSGDAFSSVLTSVDKKKRDNSLPLLEKAGGYFTKSISGKSCSGSDLNNPRVANACLYIGFNKTIKAVNTVTYLTGDINHLVDSINSDSNSTPTDMRASLDALAWASDASFTPSSDTNITADSVTIKGNSFANIRVEYSGVGVFYRLAKSTTRGTPNSTVVSDGYCDANGNKSACDSIENSDGSIDLTNQAAASCYACPVMTDNTSMDISKLLVDTINNGTDTIAAVSGDSDIIDSINDFKKEITGSSNGQVTIQNIIDYLNK